MELLEQFAFVEDREEVLRRLVPETKEYFKYSLLHGLNNGQDVEPMLKRAKRYLKESKRCMNGREEFASLLKEVELKNMLLKYETDEMERLEVLDYLKRTFDVNVSHSSTSGQGFAAHEVSESSMDDQGSDIPDRMEEKEYDFDFEDKSLSPENLTKDAVVHLYAAKKLNGFLAFALLTQNAEAIPHRYYHEFIIEGMKTNEKITFQTLTEKITISMLTLDQLEAIYAAFPEDRLDATYFHLVEEKMTSIDVQENAIDTADREALEPLLRFCEWLDGKFMAPQFTNSKTQAFKRALEGLVAIGDYRESFFLKYLELEYGHSCNQYDRWEIMQKFKNLGLTQEQQSSLLENGYTSQKKLDQLRGTSNLKQYGISCSVFKQLSKKTEDVWELIPPLIHGFLGEVFREADDIQPFDEFLPVEILSRLFVYAKTITGQPVDAKLEAYRPKNMESIAKARTLAFLPSNRTIFGASDNVHLKIRVKNIKTILVKVFEIDSLNYIKTSLENGDPRKITADLDLTGITPTSTKTIPVDVTDKSKALEQDMALYDIIPSDARGVFVVHVIGSNHIARALIRKGCAIYMEPKITVAGLVCTVYDAETNAPVSGASIRVEDDFDKQYVADDQTEIFLPFATGSGTQPESKLVILQHGNVCVMDRISFPKEFYTLSGTIITPREGIRTGAQPLRICIHPTLFLADQQLDLDLLTETKVLVTMELLSSRETVRKQIGVKMEKGNKDYIVEIDMRKPIANLHVTFSGKIETLKGKKVVLTLSQPNPVAVNQIVSTTNFIDDIHFLRSTDGYGIQILGRNGEKRVGKRVLVRFVRKFIQGASNLATFSKDLRTDGRGVIFLGSLRHISGIEVLYGSLSASFKVVPDFKHEIVQKKTFKLTQEQTKGFAIPNASNQGGDNNVSFRLVHLRRSRNGIYGCFKDLSHFLEPLNLNREFLVINTNLRPGKYALIWNDNFSTSIRIKVVLGASQFSSSSSSPTANPLIVPPNPFLPQYPCVEKCELGNDNRELVVKLFKRIGPNTRIHVIGTHFAHDVLDLTFSNPEIVVPYRKNNNRGKEDSHRSSYLPSTILDPEDIYILERKKRLRGGDNLQIGNMLPKPSLLLKPKENGDTVSDFNRPKKKSKDGYGYGGEPGPTALYPPQSPQYQESYGGGYQYGQRMGRTLNAGAVGGFGFRMGNMSGTTYNCLDFLDHGSTTKVLYNAHVVARNAGGDGQTFHIDLKPFLKSEVNMIQIVVLDDYSFRSVKNIPIGNALSSPKDLRLQYGFPVDAHMIEQQIVQVLKANDSLVIEQVASASMEEFNSLDKVFQTLCDDATTKEKFGFLLRWPTLSDEEKRRKLQEHGSHELHFFIFHKDRPFFDSVVRPSILSKLEMERTFIDDYLTDQDLSIYQNTVSLSELRPFELLLLFRKMGKDLKPWLKDHLQRPHIKDHIAAQVTRFWKLASTLENEDDDESVEGRRRKLSSSSDESEEDEEDEDDGGFVHVPAPSSLFGSSSASGFGGGGGGVAVSQNASLFGAASMAASNVYDRNMQQQQEQQQQMKYMAKRAKALEEVKYEELQVTKEFGETTSLFPLDFTLNHFWEDYYLHAGDDDGPFLSKNLVEINASNVGELLFALGVIDLPLECARMQMDGSSSSSSGCKKKFVGADVQLTITDPVTLVAYQNIAPTKLPTNMIHTVMIYQHFFDPEEKTRYDEEKKQSVDNFIVGEFLANKIYEYEVICANMSSFAQEIKLLHQVPNGSIPIGDCECTKSENIHVDPYDTFRQSYKFYFPEPGKFSCFPAHAMSNSNELVGFGEGRMMTVVETYGKSDTVNWTQVCASGSREDVVTFLRTANMDLIDLEKIAYRMRDRTLYDNVLAVLRERVIFQQVLWGYAFYHNDAVGMKEFLVTQKHDLIKKLVIGWFDKAKTLFDPNITRTSNFGKYHHREYFPLVNPRAHGRNIQFNKTFSERYTTFLEHLSRYPRDKITPDLSSQLLYFLIMQDRFDASYKLLDDLKGGSGPTIDYMNAYLDFSSANSTLEKARAILKAHQKEPVPRWAKFFREIETQLQEIDSGLISNKTRGISNAQNPSYSSKEEDFSEPSHKFVDVDPSFTFKVVDGEVVLRYNGLKELTGEMKLYEIDVEHLFSHTPFQSDHGARFAYVRANKVVHFTLAPNANTNTSPIDQRRYEGTDRMRLPTEFANNVRIEISCSGVTKSQNYYSDKVFVQFIKSLGQIIVQDPTTKTPLIGAYCKVYAKTRTDSSIFYKDGYTDRRGMFDYATVTTSTKLNDIKEFAILIKTTNNGSFIINAEKPTKM